MLWASAVVVPSGENLVRSLFRSTVLRDKLQEPFKTIYEHYKFVWEGFELQFDKTCWNKCSSNIKNVFFKRWVIYVTRLFDLVSRRVQRVYMEYVLFQTRKSVDLHKIYVVDILAVHIRDNNLLTYHLFYPIKRNVFIWPRKPYCWPVDFDEGS